MKAAVGREKSDRFADGDQVQKVKSGKKGGRKGEENKSKASSANRLTAEALEDAYRVSKVKSSGAGEVLRDTSVASTAAPSIASQREFRPALSMESADPLGKAPDIAPRASSDNKGSSTWSLFNRGKRAGTGSVVEGTQSAPAKKGLFRSLASMMVGGRKMSNPDGTGTASSFFARSAPSTRAEPKKAAPVKIYKIEGGKEPASRKLVGMYKSTGELHEKRSVFMRTDNQYAIFWGGSRHKGWWISTAVGVVGQSTLGVNAFNPLDIKEPPSEGWMAVCTHKSVLKKDNLKVIFFKVIEPAQKKSKSNAMVRFKSASMLPAPSESVGLFRMLKNLTPTRRGSSAPPTAGRHDSDSDSDSEAKAEVEDGRKLSAYHSREDDEDESQDEPVVCKLASAASMASKSGKHKHKHKHKHHRHSHEEKEAAAAMVIQRSYRSIRLKKASGESPDANQGAALDSRSGTASGASSRRSGRSGGRQGHSSEEAAVDGHGRKAPPKLELQDDDDEEAPGRPKSPTKSRPKKKKAHAPTTPDGAKSRPPEEGARSTTRRAQPSQGVGHRSSSSKESHREAREAVGHRSSHDKEAVGRKSSRDKEGRKHRTEATGSMPAPPRKKAAADGEADGGAVGKVKTERSYAQARRAQAAGDDESPSRRPSSSAGSSRSRGQKSSSGSGSRKKPKEDDP